MRATSLASTAQAIALVATAACCESATLEQVRLPPGFKIAHYAEDVSGARAMTLASGGVVFVGTRDAGTVYAVLDGDGDQRAERVVVVAKGLDGPNGVAFREGSLYVAEVSRVLRYDGILDWLKQPGELLKPHVVNDTFPNDHHHGWKFIAFGPDELLYVPVGAPCNVCKKDDPRYASITRMKADGTGFEIFANGVRNTVGFDWHPTTKQLWFTDNGRDRLGDDIPPDELNHAPRPGMHFGFPHCHGGDLADPEHGAGRQCRDFTPPAAKLGPHVAALGMRFYTGRMFPEKYRHQIFIAEHGSWNRSKKIGYRVMLVRLDGARVASYEPFAEGWLQGERVSGRPVDVLVMPDGALLVSDDMNGVVYRISYGD